MSKIIFNDNKSKENRYVTAVKIEVGISFIFTKDGLYEFIKSIDNLISKFKVNIKEYNDAYKVTFGDKNDDYFIDNHVEFIYKFKNIN